MDEYSEEELQLLIRVLPNLSRAMRETMTNIYIAVGRIVPQEQRESDPALDSSASMFQQSYYRLYRLISNMDTAARLAETGRAAPRNDDLAGLCRTVCLRAEDLFRQKGVELRFESERSSLIVAMDSALIERLLLNLLSNALRFTPEGGIVTVRVQTGRGNARLTVSDTGRGVAPEKLEHIFEDYRYQPIRDGAPQGAGLGLTLCRHIAQAHGGTIVAQSEPGRGASFTVTLPQVTRTTLTAQTPRLTCDGFNETLVQLSDALPASAFSHFYQD